MMKVPTKKYTRDWLSGDMECCCYVAAAIEPQRADPDSPFVSISLHDGESTAEVGLCVDSAGDVYNVKLGLRRIIEAAEWLRSQLEQL